MLKFGTGFLPFSASYISEISELNESEKVGNQPQVPAVQPPSSSSISQTKNQLEAFLNVIGRSSDDLYVVALNVNQLTHFSGYAHMKVIKGSMTVNGYRLDAGQDSSLRSSSWCSALQLHAIPTNKVKALKTGILEYDQFLSKLLPLMEPFSCCFLLRGESVDDNSAHDNWLTTIDIHSNYSSLVSSNPPVSLSSTSFTTCNKLTLSTGILANGIEMTHHNITLLDYPVSWMEASEKLIESLPTTKSTASSTTTTATTNTSCPRAMICGAKGVGKSSCMRYMINRLLSSKIWKNQPIALIDCDLGQPERTTPGMISLHIITQPMLMGTFHTYSAMNDVEESYFLGDITSRYEPELFCEGLKKLYQRYVEYQVKYAQKQQQTALDAVRSSLAPSNSSKFNVFSALSSPKLPEEGGNNCKSEGMSKGAKSTIPLIVNTDGFVRYMGAEILCAIAEIVQPTHLLHISTEKDRWLPIFDMLYKPNPQTGARVPCEVITLTPGRIGHGPNANAATTYDLRNLRLITYFVPRLSWANGEQSELTKGESSGENDGKLISIELMKSVSVKNNALINDEYGILTYQLLTAPQSTFLIPFSKCLIHTNRQDISPMQLLHCLNRSFVSLSLYSLPASTTNQEISSPSALGWKKMVIQDPSSVTQHNDELVDMKTISIQYTTNMPLLKCIGMGIIRAIDLSRQVFVLASPCSSFFPQEESAGRHGSTVLVMTMQTNIQLPTMLINGSSLPFYPFATGEIHGEGSIQAKPRSNLKRKYHKK
jgi:polynucleotide 5'-kinase involved in rRNA processing